ncbi:MAG: hypothetical protein GY699_09550 [Desulfobacteraceae bacterium]|nr:hypothetical protein [Desulfobacteraceae bacterium]
MAYKKKMTKKKSPKKPKIQKVKIVGGPVESSVNDDMKWKYESAADALVRAAEIKQDKKLYKGAMDCIKRKKKALEKI